MHRFYLPPEQCRGDRLVLEEREYHHAVQVLRLQPGHPVVVLDGRGRVFHCEVAEAARKCLSLAVRKVEHTPPPPGQVTLLQAIPRGQILESIIQKATELGAWRVVPLLTERVVAQYDAAEAARKAAKWQQTAIEAIKQCGQAWLPRVEAPVSLKSYLARGETYDLALVAALTSDVRHPRSWFDAYRARGGGAPRTLCLWIGPEGDFAPAELEAILASGARPVTLGPLVLRCETAALCALSVVNHELTSGG